MSASDETLYETMVRVENKDIFVDLKKNKGGVYLKISERNGAGRNTVLIPSSGIMRLKAVLDEVVKVSTKSKAISKERKTRAVGDPSIVSRSIYVSGLSWDTNDEELLLHFSQAGAVAKAVIMRQRRGGNNKSSMGCGVVEFTTEEGALNALQTMSETELKGRVVHCREDRTPAEEEAVGAPAADAAISKPRANGEKVSKAVVAESNQSTSISATSALVEKIADPLKVFVSGLDWTVTDEELHAFFSVAGTVISAKVMTQKRGRSMGSGIVEFADISSVQAAVINFNQVELKGRKIGVRQYYQ